MGEKKATCLRAQAGRQKDHLGAYKLF